MTQGPQITVAIVSRKRPAQLQNCLAALQHQIFRNFEIVLVADSCPAPFRDRVKFVPFSLPNISAARNIAIKQAAGEIIAFCDDDAIPDRLWLHRLFAPFTTSDIASATGFTRGRNGLSRQWGAMRFDRFGNDIALETDLSTMTIFDPNPESPVKLIGTNMAIRRKALTRIGGFDEAFAYYLDETDVKLRLDKVGYRCAVVPDAQVQHIMAKADHRTSDRTIIDWHQIVASKSFFLKKHAPDNWEDALDRFCAGIAVKGEAADQVISGKADGLQRESIFPTFDKPDDNFRAFVGPERPHVVIVQGVFDRKWARTMRDSLIAEDVGVTVLEMRPSPHYFQYCFKSNHWQYRGGVFGKSERSQPLFKVWRFATRAEAEVQRISALNPVDLAVFNRRGSYCPSLPYLSSLKNHKVMKY